MAFESIKRPDQPNKSKLSCLARGGVVSAGVVCNLLFIITCIFALTGFVCTYKIQAEEECLSSNVLCYECDSRYDPNCADPFELSSLSLIDQQALEAHANFSNSTHLAHHGHTHNLDSINSIDNRQHQHGIAAGAVGSLNTSLMMMPKKPPNVVVCHGCCVKMTSKTPDGSIYVKRTCTTNLQINYFMVGLVCMKESGDRGKMCFCETDYCNGQHGTNPTALVTLVFLILAILMASCQLIPYSRVTTSVLCRSCT